MTTCATAASTFRISKAVRAPAAIAGFKSASGFIRRELGKSLGLRYTPELDFEFDPGLERAARIDALLKQSSPKD